ncbi:murein biosynthesis integral membrane protein MurJ [Patescibacteria group bacterium]
MVKDIFKQSQKLLQKQQSSILSAATIITFASFLSAALGFIRERILISYFFDQYRSQLDAFRIASRFPELAFQLLVVGALSAAFIPVFSKYLNKSKEEAYKISSSVINIILVLFFIVSAVIYFKAESFIKLITSAEFTLEQIHLAANLTRVMLLAQFFFAISNFLTGMIQSHHRFLVPALSPLAHNIGIISGIVFLTPAFGIYSAAIGIVIGSFLHLIFQIPLAKKLGFKYQLTFNFSHKGVREMIKLMPPRTLTISINQLEFIATGFFATAMTSGSLTIFEIAQRLMSAPIRIFAVPIGQASLPFLSKESAKKDLEKFKLTVLNSLHKIIYLTLPASVILLILRIPIVRILYGAKGFPWSATIITGKTVAILSLSVFAQGAHHIISRAFYALENTKTPFITALVSMVVNIFLAWLFTFKYNFEVLGIALALTFSAVLHFFILLFALTKLVGGFNHKQLLRPIYKMTLASILTGIFLWMPMKLLDNFVFDTTRTVPLVFLTIISAAIGFVVYIGISKILGIPELQEFSMLIKKIGNWNKVLNKTDEVIDPTSQSQEIKPI